MTYRTNVESYPHWQAYLRERQPPTLVLWGKYDTSFTVAGATAYGRDVPRCQILSSTRGTSPWMKGSMRLLI
jgi:hypothetical protein